MVLHRGLDYVVDPPHFSRPRRSTSPIEFPPGESDIRSPTDTETRFLDGEDIPKLAAFTNQTKKTTAAFHGFTIKVVELLLLLSLLVDCLDSAKVERN